MKKRAPTNLLCWLPVVVLCLAIFVQSCFPATDAGPDFPMKDKLLHMAVYGLLAGLFSRAARRTWGHRLTRLQLLAAGIGFATFYGLSDEWHQAFVATRQADVLDGVADFAGSVLGATIYARLYLPKATRFPFPAAGDAEDRRRNH
ncbi:MAG TPA: VanZ family protein [Desulfosarcina sp.]|nr:VanZ family protein [Desulfosarcina sp.]